MPGARPYFRKIVPGVAAEIVGPIRAEPVGVGATEMRREEVSEAAVGVKPAG